jgi:hypothetical protein
MRTWSIAGVVDAGFETLSVIADHCCALVYGGMGTLLSPLNAEAGRILNDAADDLTNREQIPPPVDDSYHYTRGGGRPNSIDMAAYGLREWIAGEPCEAPSYFTSIADDLERIQNA